MNSRSLAVTLSSVVSQLLLLLLHLPPPSSPLFLPAEIPNIQKSTLPLLHLLAASDIAAAVSVISFSRKRKRAHGGPVRIPRTPDSFTRFFGMKASTFEWLCGLLDPLLDCRDPVDSPLNLAAETRLGIGLFRLSAGADFPEIASRFGVSEEDARFCVKQLCRVLCTNYRFWVGLPSPQELDSVAARFEALTKLPNCCGVIGCSRFQAEKSDGSDFSIAAQIAVDSSSRILSIAAGFHGHKSDHRILKSSSLYNAAETLNSEKSDRAIPRYFLGIGDYPLLPWLILPFPDPNPLSEEDKFNHLLSEMTIPWLNADLSLRKWGVLSGGSGVKIGERNAAVACVAACSILHNMLIMREDYTSFCEEVDDDFVSSRAFSSFRGSRGEEEDGARVRRALCDWI